MKPYVYFLGIGGIGMSALARWFQANGHQVSGYDKTATPLTEALTAEGIAIHYADAVDNIPAAVRENREQTLVVLTPAIPKDHQEWAWLREQGYDIRKRSQVLGVLTEGRPTLAVAGTHGKTTTSSMLAHLLHHAGLPVGAFLGGISVNLGSNLLLPERNRKPALTTDNSQLAADTPIVVEADEYDRSFLTLYPDVAIITSTDADHLDIYGDKDALVESFRQFAGQIKPGGTLLLNHTADASVADAVGPQVRVIRYGLTKNEGPELYSSAITAEGHQFHFDLHSVAGSAMGLQLSVPGYHNVENMLAAACVAQLQGVNSDSLKAGVAAYRGVKRRFEFIVTATSRTGPKVYVDDYAHHPREIDAFLRSLRALYPGKRLRVVFQPHLFTRTRDFLAGFADSLSLADEVVLLDIYPARELPLPGITSALLLDLITAPVKSLQTKEQVLTAAQTDDSFDVLATVGAGDIDQLVPRLRSILDSKWNGTEA
ncbi:UDP-N-acetylmuramate--L-alanine ligase [Hymenobacter sp. BT507]|uniref:UDP-N-acetylmuramate--L-alanine ligase n=1 Tax=Hymenobacter citatus TaxID=2763506 RepID=A0ABR7ML64_9BACT|nr:UDP-N-acetylmuramate--L-alanine ligase [Hymenobacter citatus]MBC6611790.1 UDP-N-acetylmuramate--L-alanine ligase [Hymenobacter citatus]